MPLSLGGSSGGRNETWLGFQSPSRNVRPYAGDREDALSIRLIPSDSGSPEWHLRE